MPLRDVYRLATARPAREEGRFAIRYLRLYDPKSYRAISKVFQIKHGIHAEEWADELQQGGTWQRYWYNYKRWFYRHDYGVRHVY